MNRKSQISIFIILGAFVLITVILLYSVRNRLTDMAIEAPVDDSFSRDDTLEVYFEDCVRMHTEEAVSLILKQGGYIFEEQGGTVSRDSVFVPLGVDYKDLINYTYGISNATRDNLKVPVDFDPDIITGSGNIEGLDTYTGKTKTGLFNIYEGYGFFGTVTLPKLCNRDGPNGEAGAFPMSCSLELYNEGNSDKYRTVQSQLNNYLSQVVKTCVNSDVVLDYYDVTSMGDGQVEVIFYEEDLRVDSNLTINYVVNGIQRTFDVSYIYPLRVKRLYTLGYFIAKNDVSSIYFDKVENASYIPRCNGNCYDSFFNVTLLKNNSFFGLSNDHYLDDVFILKDRKSRISRGNAESVLELRYLVENRRPHLEFIPDQPILPISGDDFSEGALQPDQRTAFFEIKVLDPDEKDAFRIYDRTDNLGVYSLDFSRKADPEYYDRVSGLWDSFNTDKFVNVPVTTFNDVILQRLVASCSVQCKPCPDGELCYNNKPYILSRYELRVEVSDGAGTDWQDFWFIVSPN